MPLLPWLLAGTLLGSPPHDGIHEQIAQVTKRIAEDGRDASLFLRRGELYRIHGEWDAALADLDRAEDLRPELDGLALSRSRLFRDRGWLGSARCTLDRLLSRCPNDGEALLLSAEVHALAGDARAAIDEAARALAVLEAPQPEHYVTRARLIASLGAGHVAEALASLEEGTRRLGPALALELYAVELEVERGHYDAALARIAAVAERSPRKERWLAQKGDILFRAGRMGEAADAFLEARAAIARLAPKQRGTRAVRDLDAHLTAQMMELRYPAPREGETKTNR